MKHLSMIVLACIIGTEALAIGADEICLKNVDFDKVGNITPAEKIFCQEDTNAIRADSELKAKCLKYLPEKIKYEKCRLDYCIRYAVANDGVSKDFALKSPGYCGSLHQQINYMEDTLYYHSHIKKIMPTDAKCIGKC